MRQDYHALEACMGENIASERAKQGMSMAGLSRASGVAVSIIARVERGMGTSVYNLCRLADGLRLHPSIFLFASEPAPAGSVTEEVIADDHNSRGTGPVGQVNFREETSQPA